MALLRGVDRESAGHLDTLLNMPMPATATSRSAVRRPSGPDARWRPSCRLPARRADRRGATVTQIVTQPSRASSWPSRQPAAFGLAAGLLLVGVTGFEPAASSSRSLAEPPHDGPIPGATVHHDPPGSPLVRARCQADSQAAVRRDRVPELSSSLSVSVAP